MSDFQQTITSLNLLYTSLYRMELFQNAQGVKNVKTDVISLISRLEAAERERGELRAIAEEQSKLAGSNAARAQKAEAEIARRDAAAGEPVGQVRLGEYGSDGIRPASVVCLHDQAGWENFPDGTKLYAAAQPQMVVELPAVRKSDDVAYGGAGAFTMGISSGFNECLAIVTSALDAANVKWEVRK